MLTTSTPWSNLNSWGQSRILRSSYIWFFMVPLSARLFSKLPDNVNLNLFGVTWPLVIDLPFSWIVFYFSAVFFMLATLIYSLACPPIVKRYKNLAEFRAQGRVGAEVRSHLVEMLKSDRKRWENVTPSLFVDFVDEYTFSGLDDENREALKTDPDRILKLLEEHEVRDARFARAFWHVHSMAEDRRPALRVVCLLSFLAGFVLFGVVLIQNLVYVVGLVIKQYFV